MVPTIPQEMINPLVGGKPVINMTHINRSLEVVENSHHVVGFLREVLTNKVSRPNGSTQKENAFTCVPNPMWG